MDKTKRGTWESMAMFKLLDFSFHYDEDEQVCTVSGAVNEYMLNPIGTIHGGFYPYIADTAMGHALNHFQEAPYVALELTSKFFGTITEGKIIAKASFKRRGYKICFLTCPIYDEHGNLLAETSGTFYRKEA